VLMRRFLCVCAEGSYALTIVSARLAAVLYQE
jgi:hypothetical protein